MDEKDEKTGGIAGFIVSYNGGKTVSRKTAREIALHILYELEYGAADASELLDTRLSEDGFRQYENETKIYAKPLDDKDAEYIRLVVTGVAAEKEALDELITRYSRRWKIERISRITTSILRMALFEMRAIGDIPEAVAINEAIELAKHYESPEAAVFVNGILGSVSRGEIEDSAESNPTASGDDIPGGA